MRPLQMRGPVSGAQRLRRDSVRIVRFQKSGALQPHRRERPLLPSKGVSSIL